MGYFTKRPSATRRTPEGQKKPGARRGFLQVLVNAALFVDFSLAGFLVATLPHLFLHLDPDVPPNAQPTPDLLTSTALVLMTRYILCFVLSLPAGMLGDVINGKVCLIFGLLVNFASALACAYAGGKGALNFGAWIQGVGSAFVRVAALGVLAGEYKENVQRIKALAVAAIFILAGALLGPVAALLLYTHVGKSCPYIVLGWLSFVLALAILIIVLVGRFTQGTFKGEEQFQHPTVQMRKIVRLLIDPCVLICSISLMAITCNPAFTEQFVSNLMSYSYGYRVSTSWLYVFLPLIWLVAMTAFAIIRRARYAWVACCFGLSVTGIANVALGISTYGHPVYMLPIFVMQTIGAALFLPALLILLSFRVDNRYGIPIYGSIYGIANMSATALYIFGAVFCDTNKDTVDLTYTGIFVSLCVPLMSLNSRVHRKDSSLQARSTLQDQEQPQAYRPSAPNVPLEPMPSTSGLQSSVNVHTEVRKDSSDSDISRDSGDVPPAQMARMSSSPHVKPDVTHAEVTP